MIYWTYSLCLEAPVLITPIHSAEKAMKRICSDAGLAPMRDECLHCPRHLEGSETGKFTYQRKQSQPVVNPNVLDNAHTTISTENRYNRSGDDEEDDPPNGGGVLRLGQEGRSHISRNAGRVGLERIEDPLRDPLDMVECE